LVNAWLDAVSRSRETAGVQSLTLSLRVSVNGIIAYDRVTR